MSTLIVIIEDDEDILELLEYNLQKEGYETLGSTSTKNLQQLLEEEKIDLLLMDRNLPGEEGSEFIQKIRKDGDTTPVIYLSAKNKESEIEEGFLRGADDYITKPFNMKELLLRIKALLRRTKPDTQEGLIGYKDILLNLDSRSVSVANEEISLSKLEFDLLHTLINNQNVVLTRDSLLDSVWGDDENFQYRTVNVAINRLKEKIDPTKEKEYIKTVRGVGYTLC